MLFRFIIKDQMCAGYGMVNIVAECVGHKAPHGSVSSKICLVFKPPPNYIFRLFVPMSTSPHLYAVILLQ